MIITGIILILIAVLLPGIIAVPVGIIHAAWVVGWILVVVGVILLLLGHFRGPVGGRRYWW